jgi:hypothetical protein
VATNPIQRIRDHAHDSPLDLDAARTLGQLATLPPSTAAPYLSLSLDWRPQGSDPGRAPASEPRPSERRSGRDDGFREGTSRRPSRQVFEREVAKVIEGYGPRGAAFDSLTADIERIGTFLDEELNPAAQGIFIVACSAAGVFEPLALGLPLPTRLAVGPTPALGALARLIEDHPAYAVLLADQHEATLSFITQATRGQSVALESTDYPRKQQQGGWSQRRFQARADERVAAFARGIADEVARALDETGVDLLVVAGDEVITSALDPAFHPTVKERIIETIRLDNRASEREIVEATHPLAEQAEREREISAAAAVRDAVGAGGLGVAGAEATVTALQAGQVETLVIGDDFAAGGWADYGLPVYGVGEPPSEHPAGGDPADLVAIALEEEVIRLALLTGAEVQIVHSAVPLDWVEGAAIPEAGTLPPRSEAATLLDELGGIGAVLRFALDDEQSVADV